MTFAEKLVKLRKSNGMSQEDLADKLGVSRQAISKWESMQSVPDLLNVLNISSLFKVSTDYLLKADCDCKRADDIATDVEFVESVSAESHISGNDANAGENCGEDCCRGEADTRNATIVCGQDAAMRHDAKDKNFAVATCVFLLVAPLLDIAFMSVSGNAFTVIVLLFLSVADIALYIAAGVMAVLYIVDKKFLGISACLLLAERVLAVVLMVFSSKNTIALFRLISGFLSLIMAILLVLRIFAKDKVKLNGRVLLALPSVCALISGIVLIFSTEFDGNSITIFRAQAPYIAMFFMAAILFREDGYEKRASEGLGIAGFTFLALMEGVNILNLLVMFFISNEDEVVFAYLCLNSLFFFMAFLLIPWTVYYTYKGPREKGTPGYVGIIRHILLTCYTFFVWHYIWVYRTTEYLKATDKKGKVLNPVAQLLLYMFVPFYYIYWYNKHGHRISEIEKERGFIKDSKVELSVVFEILSPFVASAMMQNRINAIA